MAIYLRRNACFQSGEYKPRPSNEIYALRREKEYDRARAEAEKIIAEGDADDDVWKAYGWTLIDIYNRESQNGNTEEARDIVEILAGIRLEDENEKFSQILLRKIDSLKLTVIPEYSQIQKAKELSKNGGNDEAIAIYSSLAAAGKLPPQTHVDYGWVIYRYLKSHIEELDSGQVRSRLRDYIQLQNERPSLLHSQILSFALNYAKKDNGFKLIPFLELWGLGNLREEDWQEWKGSDGTVYSPLAVKMLRGASKALGGLPAGQGEDLQWLIDLYDVAVRKFPDDDWNIRSKALLLLRTGRAEEARNIYKKLCRTLGDKYYIWQECAGCWDEPDLKTAFLCKALSLEKNEDFIGKIRLQLAGLLVGEGKYENAAFELGRYVEHYTKMDWHVSSEAEDLLAKIPPSTKVPQSDEEFYSMNIPAAEECVYADLPCTEVVLVDKWKNSDGKEQVKFMGNGSVAFIVNKKRHPALKGGHIGQVWNVRMHIGHPASGSSCAGIRYIPLTMSPSEAADWSVFPQKYGVVDYVNVGKKVYHICSPQGETSYEHFEKQTLKKGDFVRYRQYGTVVKGVPKTVFCDVQGCDAEEAGPAFPPVIAAVDDVNAKKELFHFVLGPGKMSGILHFNETSLHPSVGDCIKIRCYPKTIEGKNGYGGKKVLEVLESRPTGGINSDALRDVSGLLSVHYRDSDDWRWDDDEMDDDLDGGQTDGGWGKFNAPDFAFVDDCYVHKSLLERHRITSDCHVHAAAVYTGRSRWKVYRIDKVERE